MTHLVGGDANVEVVREKGLLTDDGLYVKAIVSLASLPRPEIGLRRKINGETHSLLLCSSKDDSAEARHPVLELS